MNPPTCISLNQHFSHALKCIWWQNPCFESMLLISFIMPTYSLRIAGNELPQAEWAEKKNFHSRRGFHIKPFLRNHLSIWHTFLVSEMHHSCNFLIVYFLSHCIFSLPFIALTPSSMSNNNPPPTESSHWCMSMNSFSVCSLLPPPLPPPSQSVRLLLVVLKPIFCSSDLRGGESSGHNFHGEKKSLFI